MLTLRAFNRNLVKTKAKEENKKEKTRQKSKYLCEHPTCTKNREYYCVNEHQMAFCQSCHKYHRHCTEIIDVKDLREVLEEFKKVCKVILKYQDLSAINACSKYLDGVDITFKNLYQNMYLLDKKINQAIDDDAFPKFQELKDGVDSLVSEIEEDPVLRRIGFLWIESIINHEHFAQEKNESSENSKLKKKLNLMLEEHKNAIEVNYKAMRDREEEIKIEEIEQSLNAQIQELDEELEETRQDRENIKQDFKETVDRITPNVDMDLSKEEGKRILDLISKSFLVLPVIKNLVINNVKNDDQGLRSFLGLDSVATVRNFIFNHFYLMDEEHAIRFGFYREHILKPIGVTSHEVYLSKMILEPQDLSAVVKGAANSKRLIIKHCKVETSDALNFETHGDSSLEYLSFFNCGYSAWNNMHWDKDPSLFGHIITAIRGSSLKLSLKEININGCGIRKTQVKELLGEDLAHISIVLKIDNPLNC
ncbi:unnamed protein product [Moneuplotes crassus]|uniref:Uncharacterized protein n=1 Tax=Euplotes crassus TaxID=5936 RepID=A0AAD1XCR5_EUPCR|nr:unnamed protein product [Moneuplotes crassus]